MVPGNGAFFFSTSLELFVGRVGRWRIELGSILHRVKKLQILELSHVYIATTLFFPALSVFPV
jgi:hypothetical protein